MRIAKLILLFLAAALLSLPLLQSEATAQVGRTAPRVERKQLVQGAVLQRFLDDPAPHAEALAGDLVDVVYTEGDMVRVRLSNQTFGWLKADLLQDPTPGGGAAPPPSINLGGAGTNIKTNPDGSITLGQPADPQ